MSAQLPSPGLPNPQPCLSIWQRSLRQSTLVNEGADSPLPSTADAVIIGSGLSGAVTAYELLSSPNGPKNVVILEAREACSGASGRNAGHCRPDAFRGFTAFSKIHGPEQAMKIIVHEKLVLQLVKKFISTHNVDCDFDPCKTFDVIMGQDFYDYATRSFEEYKLAGGDVSDVAWLDAAEAQKKTRVPGALGAFEWSAANLHPAKLCYAVLALNKALGLSLYTHTPVTSVTAVGVASKDWLVNTARGSIRTPLVIHATNGFASTLLPLLQKHIEPHRAQAHKIIPTRPYSGPNMLTHTYSLRFSLSHFYSLIQRKSDGALVLGSSRGIPGLSELTKKEIHSTTDDSSHNSEIEEDALARFKTVFPDWGNEVQGEGHEFGWTGILGMTPDSVPYIGAVPNLPGQFVIAGFNGHGMARIFGCAPALSQIILGAKWSETTMPECFEITEERLKRFSIPASV